MKGYLMKSKNPINYARVALKKDEVLHLLYAQQAILFSRTDNGEDFTKEMILEHNTVFDKLNKNFSFTFYTDNHGIKWLDTELVD